MKINRKKLLDAVKIASKVTGKKTNFPILTCVLLNGHGQKMEATNLEMYTEIPLEIFDYTRVTDSVGVEELTGEDGVDSLKGPQLRNLADDYGIDLPGKATVAVMRETIVKACEEAATEESTWDEKFCISAKDLGEILKTLEEEDVEITLSDDASGTLFGAAPRVRIGRNFHDLATLDTEEFPALPDVEDDPEKMSRVTVNMKDLENVGIATSRQDDAGFRLGNVYFDLSDRESPCAVATDGRRLHWSTLPADHVEAPENMTGFSMPIDAVKMLKAVFEKDADVTINHSGNSNMMVVRFGDGGKLHIRGVEGQFPDWKQVVQKESEKTVTIVKTDMVRPIQQALTITNDRYSGFRMKFNGGVDVECNNPEKGAYQKFSIPIKSKNYHDGEEVEFGINGRLLLDAIGPLGTDDIELQFSDATKPMCMGHENYHALVMPMRV